MKRSNRPKNRAAKSARRQTVKTRSTRSGSSGKFDTQRIGRLFADFAAIQSRLRAPGGCPWDREQTHATLRTYLIEEAYEVLDAIERESSQDMAEELGDLLLQVLFHADIAREAGAFDISDVISGIHNKMVRRHPHVFGSVKAETSGEVLKNWAQIKAKEKQSSTKLASSQPPSTLDGVSKHLPALLEAYQLTRRAAQVGFDWEHLEGVFEKLEEEIMELRTALASLNRRAVEEELGDLLFSVVNLSRFIGFDPEVILKQSNTKFKKRFMEMEEKALASGKDLSKLSKEELEQLWNLAKSEVSAKALQERGS
jgi:MazG family protein